MSDIDNGGPAFPVRHPDAIRCKTVDELERAISGMTLRDYFAAHAPIYVSDANDAFYRQNGRNARQSEMLEMLATLRVSYADAMLEARKS